MQFYYNQYLASDNNINFNNNSDYNVNDYCWINYLYWCYDSVSSYLIFLVEYIFEILIFKMIMQILLKEKRNHEITKSVHEHAWML